jgi:hypothetical protein
MLLHSDSLHDFVSGAIGDWNGEMMRDDLWLGEEFGRLICWGNGRVIPVCTCVVIDAMGASFS